ncbi:MAG: hypothetical protein RR302_03215, partial [Victivallaceae bacterium]
MNVINGLSRAISSELDSRLIQKENCSFLRNTISLIAGVILLLLGILMLISPFVGLSTTIAYIMGTVILVVGLALSIVSLVKMDQASFLKITRLSNYSDMLERAISGVNFANSSGFGPDTNPLAASIFPNLMNPTCQRDSILNPFSRKRDMIRIISIVLGVVCLALTVLSFTLLPLCLPVSGYMTIGMISLGLGVLFLSMGIYSYKAKIMMARAYALNMQTGLEKQVIRTKEERAEEGGERAAAEARASGEIEAAEKLEDIVSTLNNTVGGIYDATSLAVEATVDGVSNAASSIVGGVSNVVTGAGGRVSSAASSVVGGVSSAASSIVGGVSSAASS